MLEITIQEDELFNEETGEFVEPKETKLQLEHSLVSLSKWESKWHKPFINNEKTTEETLDYIKFMTLNKNVDPKVYEHLTKENVKEINAYIEDPMTATTFSDRSKSKGTKEIITSEILYYDMIALNIPVEFQKWHLNRLTTLIKVCNLKSQPDKKMGRRELMNRNRALNEARRKKLNSKG